MQKINLFPIWVRQRKRRRQVIKSLLAAQVVVFLLVGGLFLLVQEMEARVMYRSATMAQALLEADPAPVILAEAVITAQGKQSELTHFIEERFPVIFNPDWFTLITDTAPDGIDITTKEFTGMYILLTAIADNLTYVSTHQQALSVIEGFYSVLLGQIERQEDGRIRYNLRITVASIS
jgi:Tfp pilus assembly protein PilN